jgi:hypothetical protein
MATPANFRLVEEIDADNLGVINLGQTAKAQRYRVLVNDSGQILLDPIPVLEREQWLWENPQALASVQRGLEQAARGEQISLGSFARYADLDIED